MRRTTVGLSVILTLSLLVAPLAAEAQQPPAKVFRIGRLTLASPSTDDPDGFRQGLRELGYIEGQNIVIEDRSAEGSVDRLGALATDLVRRHMDVIVAEGSPAIHAAQQATGTIPIVMTTGTDAVAQGFVSSLARPEGNITGLALVWSYTGNGWNSSRRSCPRPPASSPSGIRPMPASPLTCVKPRSQRRPWG